MKTPEKLAEKVKLLKSGDNDAFTYVYEESYKYLYTCVIHIVKDEDTAQDMLQDTYVEVYKNISQLKEADDFLSWAATIANRKCYAYIKKDRDILVEEQTDDEGNEEDFFESVADDESFIPENIFDNKEKIKMIRDIIDSLTDEQRACVIGFYYNEQKQDEIAKLLNIPVNTVKSHLNRAKAKIKEAVGDIEKKQGVKLYSFSPFMLLLMSYEAKAFATKAAVPAMGASITSAIAGSSASSAGKVAATKAVKSAATALKAKIAIGTTAAVVGVATVVGIVINKGNAYIDAYVDEKAIMDTILVYDTPLTQISHEDVVSYWQQREEYYSNNVSEYGTSYTYIYMDSSSNGSNKSWEDIEVLGDIQEREISYRIDEGIFSKREELKPFKDAAIFTESLFYEEIKQTEDDLQWLYEGHVEKYPKESAEAFSEYISIRSDPYWIRWDSLYLNKKESDEISGFNISVEAGHYEEGEKPWGAIRFDQAGMKLNDYLEEILPGSYEKVKEHETVEFKNGLITSNALHHVSGKESWTIWFNDTEEINRDYPKMTIVFNEEEEITGFAYDTY